jgi:hypothetical protein
VSASRVSESNASAISPQFDVQPRCEAESLGFCEFSQPYTAFAQDGRLDTFGHQNHFVAIGLDLLQDPVNLIEVGALGDQPRGQRLAFQRDVSEAIE